MLNKLIIVASCAIVFLYSSPAYSLTPEEIIARIAELEREKQELTEYRKLLVGHLSKRGINVSGEEEEIEIPDERKEKDLVYNGKAPPALPKASPDPIDPRVTPDITAMKTGIQVGSDGKPYADVEDVLRFQRDTQKMRDLKNADPEVREAFNNTLKRDVYGPHDNKLKEYVRSLAKYKNVSPEDIRIDDYRTPKENGSFDPDDINTDRDFRVLVKKDGGWHEVGVDEWQDMSKMIFSENSGFRRPAGWDQMSGKQQMACIRDHFDGLGQMPTNKFGIEASPDYSDQAIDEKTGKRIQLDEANIVSAKRGKTILIDAEALGTMYVEKVGAALRADNKAEAIAQAQKGIHTLEQVRHGYEMQGYDTGKLSPDLKKAMDVIAGAKTDTRANPAKVEAELAALGFKGGIKEVSDKVGSQIGALKVAKKTGYSKANGFVKRQVNDLPAAMDAHNQAKDVAEVVTKSANALYTAKTLADEKAAFARMNTVVDTRNKKVADFYSKYDSDPEFRKKVDASPMKLPSRKPMKKLKEASLTEKLAITNKKDVVDYVQNVVSDVDAVHSVLKLAGDSSQSVKNVSTALGNVGKGAGVIGATINTARNLDEATEQWEKMDNAFSEEKEAVAQAYLTINRLEKKQQMIKTEVAEKHGGDWHKYVGSKRKDFYDMTPIEQAELVTNIKASANKKFEKSDAVAKMTAEDIDVLESIDAGITNTPYIGGAYGSAKNSGKLGSAVVGYGQGKYEEHKAAQHTEHLKERTGMAGNIRKEKLQEAATIYRTRIEEIKTGKAKEEVLSLQDLEIRLKAIEERIETEE